MTDVIIIGAGIIGAAVSYELSKYDLSVICLDKQSDVSEGTTKANSGIIHAGYDCVPGTLKARFNVEGARMYPQLAKQLDFPYRQNGSLILAFSEEQLVELNKLLDKSKKNKVEGVCFLDRDKVLNMEKNVNPNVAGALYVPTGGIASPYEACAAFAEVAAANGVKFEFNIEVTGINKMDNSFSVLTGNSVYSAKIIVNTAGIYSDIINNMVSETKYKIIPRKGEYLLFDKAVGGYVNSTIFQLPTKFGKGVLVTPTTHGNLMIGPSADDIDDKRALGTNREIMESIVKKASLSVNSIPMDNVITSFAGLRAHLDNHEDFIVDEAPDAKGFINAIGIESPGLSAAPAIAGFITEIIGDILQPKEKADFINSRQAITPFRSLSILEQNELIAQNDAFGKIVCRCESITEAEIVEAIRRNPGATTVDGIKRRVRAGSGRCQGGFCSSKVMEIIAREKNIPVNQVTKSGGKSYVVEGL